MRRITIPWRVFARESFAVLAAILVAFALDAWWDGHVERRDAIEALQLVDDELMTNLARLDSVFTGNEGALEAMASIISLTPADGPRLSVPEMVVLGEWSSAELLTPELGAIGAFLSAGHIEGVHSRDLRAALAGLPALFGELDEERSLILQMGLSNGLAINNAVGPATLLSLEAASPGGSFDEAVLRQVTGAILGSDEFRAQVSVSRFWWIAYQTEVESLRWRVVQVRSAIDAELSR